MQFPFIIQHRDVRARIYGKTDRYPSELARGPTSDAYRETPWASGSSALCHFGAL